MQKLQTAQGEWQTKLSKAQGKWVTNLHEAQVAWHGKVQETRALIANAATMNVNDYYNKVSLMHDSLESDEKWGMQCTHKVWVPIPNSRGHTHYAPVCLENIKGASPHMMAPPPVLVNGLPVMVGPAPHAQAILAKTIPAPAGSGSAAKKK